MNQNNQRQIRHARAQAKKREAIRNWTVILGVVFILSGYLAWTRLSIPAVPQARQEDQPTYGPADAPVTISEFSDLTCEACRSWHQSGFLFQVVDEYTGQVKLEWRDLPIITADSPKAAQAGQCAYDQGHFWEYLERVYSEPGAAAGNGRPDDLRRYAAEIGLDTEAFDTCLAGSQHLATVNFDLGIGRGMGMTGAPGFVVNGTRIIGGNPEAIVTAVEAALAVSQ